MLLLLLPFNNVATIVAENVINVFVIINVVVISIVIVNIMCSI